MKNSRIIGVLHVYIYTIYVTKKSIPYRTWFCTSWKQKWKRKSLASRGELKEREWVKAINFGLYFKNKNRSKLTSWFTKFKF